MQEMPHDLLEFIRKHESRGDYNAIWGGISKSSYPKKKITEMTIGEVIAWQDSIDATHRSEAAGAYQFMEDTLRAIIPMTPGVTLESKFDERTQDTLAMTLLKRRGYDGYVRGDVSATVFAQSLSKEWASLPCTIKDAKGRPATGQSYYAGDGLNKSGTSVQAFLNIVASSRAPRQMPPPVVEAVIEEAPKAVIQNPSTGFWAWLANLFNTKG